MLGVATTIAAGLATAAVSRSVEATQITAFPVLLGALAGLFMQFASDPTVAEVGGLMPLTGPMNLVASGWSGTDVGPEIANLSGLAGNLASTALWGVVFAAVIARFFRWEPRQ